MAAVFFLILKYLLVDRLSVALSTEGTAAYYNRNLFTCSLLIQAGSFMCSTQVSDLSLFYVKTRKSNNYCRDWYNIINFLCHAYQTRNNGFMASSFIANYTYCLVVE